MEIKFEAKVVLNKKFGHTADYEFSVFTDGDDDETKLTYDDVLFASIEEGERLGYTEDAYPQIETHCLYIKKSFANGNPRLYPVIDEGDSDMMSRQRELSDEVGADRTLVLPDAAYSINPSFKMFCEMKDAGLIAEDKAFDEAEMDALYEKMKGIVAEDDSKTPKNGRCRNA